MESHIINMNDIRRNVNIQNYYNNYYMNIPFKLTNSTIPITYNYAIRYLSNVSEFIALMREIIKKDFGLNDFDIIFNTENEDGLDINDYIRIIHNNVNLENIIVSEIMNKGTGFYVRSNNQNNEQSNNSTDEDCPVCLTSFGGARTNYFICVHHVCINCFNNWRSRHGLNTTCPLCRARLNYPFI